MAQAKSYTAGGQTISFANSCDYFTDGKAKASTLSLSVLVAIEMFNALNALSEVSHPSSLRALHEKCRCMSSPAITSVDLLIAACHARQVPKGLV